MKEHYMEKAVDISKIKNKLIIIHYSCSNINHSFPEISAISVFDTNLCETHTFPRFTKDKNDEIRLLTEFFNYISPKIAEKYGFVGWYWGDKYGLDQIIKRYKQITKKRLEFKSSDLVVYDLVKILSHNITTFLSGGLKNLANFNNLNTSNFIDGDQEIELLKKQEFEQLADSTSTKVNVIYDLLIRYLNKTLKTPTIEEIYFDFKDVGAHPIFKNNITQIKELINTKNVNIQNEVLEEFLRKLLYGNVITSLETYLSDEFTRIVINDKGLISNYVKESKKFNGDKTKFSEIYSNMLLESKNGNDISIERYVRSKCIADIRDLTFHNLNLIKPLYKNVLGIDFPKNLDSIYRAIEIRHDLIHRNGKDKNDKTLRITYTQLTKIIRDSISFANHIHKQTKQLNISNK